MWRSGGRCRIVRCAVGTHAVAGGRFLIVRCAVGAHAVAGGRCCIVRCAVGAHAVAGSRCRIVRPAVGAHTVAGGRCRASLACRGLVLALERDELQCQQSQLLLLRAVPAGQLRRQRQRRLRRSSSWSNGRLDLYRCVLVLAVGIRGGEAVACACTAACAGTATGACTAACAGTAAFACTAACACTTTCMCAATATRRCRCALVRCRRLCLGGCCVELSALLPCRLARPLGCAAPPRWRCPMRSSGGRARRAQN
eukprot:269202-Chlamydomonas_euryale.AAC.1